MSALWRGLEGVRMVASGCDPGATWFWGKLRDSSVCLGFFPPPEVEAMAGDLADGV